MLTAVRPSFTTGIAVIGVDVSIFIVPALSSNSALDQQFAVPPVPAAAVADSARAACLSLRASGFEPLLVFDGARNPLKKETNEKRYSCLEEDAAELERM